jgi:hypothetical protein
MGVANGFREIASKGHHLLIELLQLFFFQFLEIIEVKLLLEAGDVDLLLFDNFFFFHHAVP